MNPLHPVGYLKRNNSGGFTVGARDESRNYQGPEAEVSLDADWVSIETCPYEGHASLNAEALPQLIEALTLLAARIEAGTDETAKQAQPVGREPEMPAQRKV